MKATNLMTLSHTDLGAVTKAPCPRAHSRRRDSPYPARSNICHTVSPHTERDPMLAEGVEYDMRISLTILSSIAEPWRVTSEDGRISLSYPVRTTDASS